VRRRVEFSGIKIAIWVGFVKTIRLVGLPFLRLKDDCLATPFPIILYSLTMDYLLLLGLLAASLTTVAFVPQLIKVINTRSTHDISLAMYIVVCTGVLLWLIYGLILKDTPLIVANSVTFVLAGTILILKIRLK
jgi:MtN3 and saliva related transmembrane protein